MRLSFGISIFLVPAKMDARVIAFASNLRTSATNIALVGAGRNRSGKCATMRGKVASVDKDVTLNVARVLLLHESAIQTSAGIADVL